MILRDSDYSLLIIILYREQLKLPNTYRTPVRFSLSLSHTFQHSHRRASMVLKIGICDVNACAKVPPITIIIIYVMQAHTLPHMQSPGEERQREKWWRIFCPGKTFAHALFRLFYVRRDFFAFSFFALWLPRVPIVVVAVDCHHLVSISTTSKGMCSLRSHIFIIARIQSFDSHYKFKN